jgi:hypothetical protein
MFSLLRLCVVGQYVYVDLMDEWWIEKGVEGNSNRACFKGSQSTDGGRVGHDNRSTAIFGVGGWEGIILLHLYAIVASFTVWYCIIILKILPDTFPTTFLQFMFSIKITQFSVCFLKILPVYISRALFQRY